jgi:hypothetical protein
MRSWTGGTSSDRVGSMARSSTRSNWGRTLERSICAVRRTGNPAHGRHHVAEEGPSFWGGHSGSINSTPCQPMPHPFGPLAPHLRAHPPQLSTLHQMLAALKNVLARPRFKAIAACRPFRPSPDHAFSRLHLPPNQPAPYLTSRHGDANLNHPPTPQVTDRILPSITSLFFEFSCLPSSAGISSSFIPDGTAAPTAHWSPAGLAVQN